MDSNEFLFLFRCYINVCDVVKKELKLRSFKSSEHITEKGDGPYRGSRQLPFRFGNVEPKRITEVLKLLTGYRHNRQKD